VDRIRALPGLNSLPLFEGVPVDCPSEEAMRQTYRTLRWLAENYESPGSPEYEGLLEGAHCMVSCAYEIYRVHLDAEHEADRRRRER
jgi:hypothetical protein